MLPSVAARAGPPLINIVPSATDTNPSAIEHLPAMNPPGAQAMARGNPVRRSMQGNKQFSGQPKGHWFTHAADERAREDREKIFPVWVTQPTPKWPVLTTSHALS
jgi:hypothetical protein